MKKVAVVLSGCGHLDGSEIREAVGVLWALSAQGAEVQCFAPDAPQTDVVDHVKGEPMKGESRNMMRESARIARGKIKPLDQLDASQFQAVILPGGFGAAKNLSDFAAKGAEGKVIAPLQKAFDAFHAARKPIGLVCIAPALGALAFKGKGLQLTVGQHGEAAQEIEKLGQKHVVVAANGCHVDPSFRVVSTPAYMYDDAPLSQIFTGIQKLVQEVLNLSV